MSSLSITGACRRSRLARRSSSTCSAAIDSAGLLSRRDLERPPEIDAVEHEPVVDRAERDVPVDRSAERGLDARAHELLAPARAGPRRESADQQRITPISCTTTRDLARQRALHAHEKINTKCPDRGVVIAPRRGPSPIASLPVLALRPVVLRRGAPTRRSRRAVVTKPRSGHQNASPTRTKPSTRPNAVARRRYRRRSDTRRRSRSAGTTAGSAGRRRTRATRRRRTGSCSAPAPPASTNSAAPVCLRNGSMRSSALASTSERPPTTT